VEKKIAFMFWRLVLTTLFSLKLCLIAHEVDTKVEANMITAMVAEGNPWQRRRIQG